ncbi:MAG: ATP-dependent DNA helicase RecG [Firmicutes bacterium]|nr:ATP-dependent DNA helicase RecG [Bacillota bacterium]
MDINNIKGVGPKTTKLLEKLNIFTVEDLLTYYPYRYNIYSFTDLVSESDNLIVSATIESLPIVSYIKKNFNRLSFRANVNGKICNVTIFNRAFLKANLTLGKAVTLIGKYNIQKNTFTASDIKFNINPGDIEPVYHLTNGITNQTLGKLIRSVIDIAIRDLIPKEYIERYHFSSKAEAIKNIHFPCNAKDVKNAKIRLIYEELFNFSFKMNFLNKENKNVSGISRVIDAEKMQILINSLPYRLTTDQQNACEEILRDMTSSFRMNRLLLGDVGSGKTIVSTIAVYANYLSGYQAALMAPTEILAIQHYFGIKKVLDKFNVRVDVITGSMSAKEKKCVYEKVADGSVDLLIGTHAILSDNVLFKQLGLVITDEQHRFGVNQRSILQKKSFKPDVLYLSATPIPRTYAMTIYGDLDISMIKTKPLGRKEIITKVKKESDIKDVLVAMLEEIKKGHQIYIVSPLVEQNEELDLNSVNILKEKIDLAFQGKIKSEIIHGKMKQAQKDAIMNDFKNNEIKILISTTVIEVGIDVGNATMMVIFNAERFGLASLHQLRGRVGRNELQSYCYLISNYDNARLKVMEDSNDGFYISQKDFELRGHGDLFGTKQSGDMNFKIANLKNDYEILVQAKNDSEEYIKNKGYLQSEYYSDLSQYLEVVD